MAVEMQGPQSFENWKAALRGQPGGWIHEFELFTDGPHIAGEIADGIGPFQIINTIAVAHNFRDIRPALVLRVQNYLQFDSPEMDTTRDESYHGGSQADEIAAMLSLCLGIRFKAGGVTRIFGSDADSKGRPIAHLYTGDPVLVPNQDSPNRRIMKNTSTQLLLPGEARIIATFPSLSVKDATALIRAVRMYQEAMWIMEATPELSWIMFVSAVETIAARWRTEAVTPIEKMRASRPKLERILLNYGADNGEELVLLVAEQIAPYMGATKTFIDFILQFLPPPPQNRPPPFAQHPWDSKALWKTMDQIYKYRSRALHGGHPFPAPMCEPPVIVGENGELEEIPGGLATGMKGGVWLAKDTPMLLHTFEYIVRNAILNWWKSVVPASEQ